MKQELERAVQPLDGMIRRSEDAQQKFAPGSSQHTLLKNRIQALYIGVWLLKKELTGETAGMYTKGELEKARAPIASLISKSEKAQQKLKPETWQHRMLEENLKTLSLVFPLLEKTINSL